MGNVNKSAQNLSAGIVKKIKTLPALPLAAQRLCSLVEDINTDLKTIDQVISSDQALAGKLLRITNSAFYGLASRVTTIAQAVVVIGFHGVKNLALSVAFCDGTMVKSHAYVDFWRHNLATACAARKLAAAWRLQVPEEAFTAGLLHDIGALVLLGHFSEQYETVLQEASVGLEPLQELERRVFGLDHCAVGVELCRHWQIPELITAVVAGHHKPPVWPEKTMAFQLLTLAVQTGNLYANIAGLGTDGNPLDDPVLRRLARAHLRPGEPVRILGSLPDEVRIVEKLLEMPENVPECPKQQFEAGLCIDDPDMHELLEMMLAAQGCSLHRTGSSEAPSLMITDMNMPQVVNGVAHLEKMRKWLAINTARPNGQC